jgi:hypothetical protein
LADQGACPVDLARVWLFTLSHNIRSTDISLALRQLALAFKLSDMVKQQLDDVFLDALASAQGGGSLQFVHEIRGYIS